MGQLDTQPLAFFPRYSDSNVRTDLHAHPSSVAPVLPAARRVPYQNLQPRAEALSLFVLRCPCLRWQADFGQKRVSKSCTTPRAKFQHSMVASFLSLQFILVVQGKKTLTRREAEWFRKCIRCFRPVKSRISSGSRARATQLQSHKRSILPLFLNLIAALRAQQPSYAAGMHMPVFLSPPAC